MINIALFLFIAIGIPVKAADVERLLSSSNIDPVAGISIQSLRSKIDKAKSTGRDTGQYTFDVFKTDELDVHACEGIFAFNSTFKPPKINSKTFDVDYATTAKKADYNLVGCYVYR